MYDCINRLSSTPTIIQVVQLVLLFADIDECKKNSRACNKDARCNNTIGNYTCTCPKNYEGNGMGEDGCKRKAPIDMKITYISIGKYSWFSRILFMFSSFSYFGSSE